MQNFQHLLQTDTDFCNKFAGCDPIIPSTLPGYKELEAINNVADAQDNLALDVHKVTDVVLYDKLVSGTVVDKTDQSYHLLDHDSNIKAAATGSEVELAVGTDDETRDNEGAMSGGNTGKVLDNNSEHSEQGDNGGLEMESSSGDLASDSESEFCAGMSDKFDSLSDEFDGLTDEFDGLSDECADLSDMSEKLSGCLPDDFDDLSDLLLNLSDHARCMNIFLHL
jgi:hypothetical protein